ncbi:MAG: hypothetical protein JWO46_1815 [Nocardioidaceae bacterium]|nr:hypothetical protein [Nocardioidaceae bacterium]
MVAEDTLYVRDAALEDQVKAIVGRFLAPGDFDIEAAEDYTEVGYHLAIDIAVGNQSEFDRAVSDIRAAVAAEIPDAGELLLPRQLTPLLPV